MKHRRNKRKSLSVKWKIFYYFLGITLGLLVVLWVCQTVLLGVFYRNVKTAELKERTVEIVNSLENEKLQDKILKIYGTSNISVRIIETNKFESLYSSGENSYSAIHDIGAFELFDIYESALENGGEITRYYTENTRIKFPSDSDFKSDIPNHQQKIQTNQDDSRFFNPGVRPPIFDIKGIHHDLLYAKIAFLSDGTEVLVVADTIITPLDSTVSALREQLVAATVIAVMLSLMVSFALAKHISRPIETINTQATKLAKGDFGAEFDVTGYCEIEQLAKTLDHTSKELGKADKLRQELLANVSHDMKTPLTMIVGYGEVMRDIPGENTPENLQIIIDEARRLSEFVNDVLDLSKLKSGMQEPVVEKICLSELLEKIVSRYDMLFANTGIKVNLEQNDRVFVMADTTQISQVIINFIDNAVNYTGDKKQVNVRLVNNGMVAKVLVEDFGEGIVPEQLPYIWDRYYKGQKYHRRNISGSGIGLSIAKEILLSHKAKFGVESTIGKGSTFWFELEVQTKEE